MGYKDGGFEERYVVARKNGMPTRPSARYFVLDYSGADPHAVRALLLYAALVQAENPLLTAQLRVALENPAAAPAQHANADGHDNGRRY